MAVAIVRLEITESHTTGGGVESSLRPFALPIRTVVGALYLKRRQMARALEADVVACDLGAELARQQAQVLPERRFDPFFLDRRIWRHQGNRLHGALQISRVFTDNLAQQLLARREIAFRHNLGSDCLIVSGLGLLDIGDRDEAHLEAFRCLLELPRYRLLGRLFRFERVLRGQHVKVGRRDADQQILFGRMVIRFGLCDLLVGSLQLDPAIPIEHGLAQVDAPV